MPGHGIFAPAFFCGILDPLPFKIAASRVRGGIVGQPRQIIHAGIQGKGDPLALLERVVALSLLDFGIIALIDPRQKLHFYLGVAALFSQFF